MFISIYFQMHMFHGVPGFSPYLPAVLYPTPMGQNDPKPQAPKTPKPDEGVSLRPGAKSGAKSASRKPRRGKKPSKPKQDEQEVEVQRSTEGEGQGPAAGSGVTQGNAAFEFYPQYKICSSESEFSDNEGGQESRLRQKCCSVRQNSLACLHSTIKVRKTLKIKLLVKWDWGWYIRPLALLLLVAYFANTTALCRW